MKLSHVIINWIYEGNLKPFVEQIAVLAEYAFDDNDWIAIEYGVRDTDTNMDKWFDYPFLRVV